MSRECSECNDDRCNGACAGSRGYAGRPNAYLSDAFSAYQGFWVRQSEYWYDVIGRFVAGQYRSADVSQDFARYLDDWTAEYQRCVQFPLRKAQAGQVPNVVFVLDDQAEGCAAKNVPITFTLGRTRPQILATPLVSATGAGAGGAYVRADFDQRGEYAKIQLINAGNLPRSAESHFTCVVHTEASRLPIAVVHVVKRPPQQSTASTGAAPSRSSSSHFSDPPSSGWAGEQRRWAQRPLNEQLLQLYCSVEGLTSIVEDLKSRPNASVDVAKALFESSREQSRQISALEQAISAAGRNLDQALHELSHRVRALEKARSGA